MTKTFLHGRTEAIRTVQQESVHFVKVRSLLMYEGRFLDLFPTSVQTFFSEATAQEKITALRRACKRHVELTKECSKGLGQDRCELNPAPRC